MRRLRALTVTISLRVFLVLTIAIWLVSRTHEARVYFSNGDVGFHQFSVCVFASTDSTTPVSRISFTERSRAAYIYYRETWYNPTAFPGQRGWCLGGFVLKYKFSSKGLRYVIVAAAHETLFTVAVTANVLHWLYRRRKSKAVPCDD